jgi:hypothetical protein
MSLPPPEPPAPTGAVSFDELLHATKATPPAAANIDEMIDILFERRIATNLLVT